MTDNRKFKKGSGKYKCNRCDNNTRETGQGESEMGLCVACFEVESFENQHADFSHDGEIENCSTCKAHMTPKAIARLEIQVHV